MIIWKDYGEELMQGEISADLNEIVIFEGLLRGLDYRILQRSTDKNYELKLDEKPEEKPEEKTDDYVIVEKCNKIKIFYRKRRRFLNEYK